MEAWQIFLSDISHILRKSDFTREIRAILKSHRLRNPTDDDGTFQQQESNTIHKLYLLADF